MYRESDLHLTNSGGGDTLVTVPSLLRDHSAIGRILNIASREGRFFAEIFYESQETSLIRFGEKQVRGLSQGTSAGIGIRVIAGNKTGYAYSESMSEAALLEVASAAAFVATLGGVSKPLAIGQSTYSTSPSWNVAAHRAEIQRKIHLLQHADDVCRAESEYIIDVSAYYIDELRTTLVINNEGLHSLNTVDYFSVGVFPFTQRGAVRERGQGTLGGRFGLARVSDSDIGETARAATAQAVTKLDARPAPAGSFPVVINGGWGGVLVHEAVGHGLEGDFNRKGTSLYSGRIGERVASDLVTIIDDGTVLEGRGTTGVDDEGEPMRKNVLIKNGILEQYLADRLNGELLGTGSTGNGRRQSYRDVPMPRMTNTYIAEGKDNPEDLIHSVKRGIYAKQLGGGQVDITNGNFVFEVNEGYMIEEGKITYPVRNATLIGNGPEAMTRVTGLGTDFVLNKSTGNCGKDGQNVVVGVGQPTVLISALTVGGTEI